MALKTKRRPATLVTAGEPLQHDLRTLLAAVKAGELGASEFAERLESVHRVHLGEQANLPDLVAARRKASARHTDYLLSIEHHHGLERLARALGVESDPDRTGPDGH